MLAEFAEQCLAPGEAAFASQARQAFASQAGPETLAAGLDYLLVQDLRPLLPGLPAGAVVIQGQADRIVDPAQGEFLHGTSCRGPAQSFTRGRASALFDPGRGL